MTLVRKLLHDDRGERISGMLMDDSKKKTQTDTGKIFYICVFFVLLEILVGLESKNTVFTS